MRLPSWLLRSYRREYRVVRWRSWYVTQHRTWWLPIWRETPGNGINLHSYEEAAVQCAKDHAERCRARKPRRYSRYLGPL